MKISPDPGRPCFLTNPNGLNNLGTGSPKEHFCKIIWKLVQWFLTRRFLKFSILIYRENKPRPLAAMFLTNPNSLDNLCRGSPKKHFCKIILKSVQWFRTRRFFKFLIKKSIFSSCDLDMQWTGAIWTTLKEDQPRIIPLKFGQIPTSGLGGDVV